MDFEPAIAHPARATVSSWFFAFSGGQLLLPEGEEILSLRPSALPWDDAAHERHYLGRLGGMDAWATQVAQAPEGWRPVPLRTAMMAMPSHQMALASRAAQLIEWDRSHRFCGVCGTPTQRVAHERARRCPSCGHLAYPRITPAMMVLVWRPGQLLLARSPRFAPGVYSALAGFVEAGETIEECVVRESAEEVSAQVGELRYFGSQSWPFPNSLMIAFTARWQGGDIVPQPGEIEDAQWFDIDALPGIPPEFSISGFLIRGAVARMKEGLAP